MANFLYRSYCLFGYICSIDVFGGNEFLREGPVYEANKENENYITLEIAVNEIIDDYIIYIIKEDKG